LKGEEPRKWRTGDRVTLTLAGTVAHDRSGFVTVRWDDREPSTVWGADLEPEGNGEGP
jgi:hypothetical protein